MVRLMTIFLSSVMCFSGAYSPLTLSTLSMKMARLKWSGPSSWRIAPIFPYLAGVFAFSPSLMVLARKESVIPSFSMAVCRAVRTRSRCMMFAPEIGFL